MLAALRPRSLLAASVLLGLLACQGGGASPSSKKAPGSGDGGAGDAGAEGGGDAHTGAHADSTAPTTPTGLVVTSSPLDAKGVSANTLSFDFPSDPRVAGATHTGVARFVIARDGKRYVTVEASSPGLTNPFEGKDVGAVGAPGSSVQDEDGTDWSISGSGADIYGSADAFQFDAVKLAGDGSIVARLASLSADAAQPKAAVMFRASLAADAPFAMMAFQRPAGSATAGSSAVQSRSVAGGGAASETYTSGVTLPVWLKLTRAGSTFTAATSADGNAWAEQGSISIAMPSAAYVGLAVTSQLAGTRVTAVFDQVNVTNRPRVTYVDAHVPAATTHTYAVASEDGATPPNLSAFGAEVSATTPGGGPPEMPIISWGAPAYASSEQMPASAANDGTQQNQWRSYGYPAWLAYDLSKQPASARQRVVLSWWNSYNYNYDTGTAAYNTPGDYVLEGNPAPGGGGAAPTTGWVTLEDPMGNPVSVSGNIFANRTHIAMLAGMNWIRLSASAGAPNNAQYNTDCALAMDVHDASKGIDTWNFVGDSITAFWDVHNPGPSDAAAGFVNGNFQYLVHEGAPSLFAASPYQPAFEKNAIGGTTSQEWAPASVGGGDYITRYLPNFEGRYVGIQLGANDPSDDPAGFVTKITAICNAILTAGKTPVLATMSYQCQTTTADCPCVAGCSARDMSQLAAAVPGIIASFGGKVLTGPDMFGFFGMPANQKYLADGPGANGLHPDAAGQAIMRNLWAQAAYTEVYGK